jgi:hypothetical protein
VLHLRGRFGQYLQRLGHRVHQLFDRLARLLHLGADQLQLADGDRVDGRLGEQVENLVRVITGRDEGLGPAVFSGQSMDPGFVGGQRVNASSDRVVNVLERSQLRG